MMANYNIPTCSKNLDTGYVPEVFVYEGFFLLPIYKCTYRRNKTKQTLHFNCLCDEDAS